MARDWHGDYCGCCGNPCKGTFCLRCGKHLGPSYLLAWDRTYFAVHGVDCPYQFVAAVSLIEGDAP